MSGRIMIDAADEPRAGPPTPKDAPRQAQTPEPPRQAPEPAPPPTPAPEPPPPAAASAESAPPEPAPASPAPESDLPEHVRKRLDRLNFEKHEARRQYDELARQVQQWDAQRRQQAQAIDGGAA